LCAALGADYRPQSSRGEDRVLCQYFLWLLETLRERLGKPQPIQALEGLYRGWLETGTCPERRRWLEADRALVQAGHHADEPELFAYLTAHWAADALTQETPLRTGAHGGPSRVGLAVHAAHRASFEGYPTSEQCQKTSLQMLLLQPEPAQAAPSMEM
jgi:hypothetical protein